MATGVGEQFVLLWRPEPLTHGRPHGESERLGQLDAVRVIGQPSVTRAKAGSPGPG